MANDDTTTTRHTAPGATPPDAQPGGGASLLKTAFKLIVLFGVAAYLIFALTTLNRPSETLLCQGMDISIADTGFITPADVRALLEAQGMLPEGRNFDDIRLADMESCLVASSYVSQALCYQTPEGKIAVNIKPRKPIIHVLNSLGEDFYIDNSGGTMPRSGHTADLLVMTGHVDRATAPALYTDMALTMNADTFWRSRIEEIHVDPHGELLLTPRLGNHTIVLGDTAAIADKLHRLRLFYEEAMPQAGWSRYKTISLKFDNQIVCTKWE